MYKVESDIPVPNPAINGGRGKYPWRLLKVGDSFFVPRNDFHREEYRPKPTDAMNIKVTSRKCLENEIWGIRVWRTE